jgi:hypothetical protein
MKLGDLVRRFPMGTDPQEAADYAELGVGIVIGFENALTFDDVATSADIIVMWSGHPGIVWEFPERLEVISEAR